MNKHKYPPFLLLTLLLVTGCIPRQAKEINPIEIGQNGKHEQATIFQRTQEYPTSAPTQEVPTGIQPTTDNKHNSDKLILSCVALSDEPIPADLGSLIVFKEIEANATPILKTGDYYLYNLSTRQEILIPVDTSIQKINYPVASPDRKQIAYRSVNSENIDLIVIADREGSVLLEDKWPPEWSNGLIVRWWDNQKLLIQVTPGNFSNQVIYNPWTRSKVELPLRKDIYNLWDPLAWNGSSLQKYSPQLDRVIYPVFSDNDFGYRVELHDTNSGKLLTSFLGSQRNEPQWSENGNFFITSVRSMVSGNFLDTSIYKIARDGSKELLLSLDSIQTNPQVLDFNLSNNANYLAFWMGLPFRTGEKFIEQNLTMIDITSGKVYQLCLSRGAPTTFSKPIWSPDDRYIAASIVVQENQKLSEIVIIDTSNMVGYRTGISGTPDGWVH